MALTDTALRQAAAEWQAAPRASRTATAQRLAGQLGCSVATLYRHFRSIGHQGPARDRAANLADTTNTSAAAIRYRQRREWADTLAALTGKNPTSPIPLDLCLEAAVTQGLLPPEASEVRVSTYARLIRERGYRTTEQRGRRLSADYPMQAVQFDASTSKSFRVLKRMDDGDRLLELWARPDPASGYKNKPLGADRERVILYGQWDMCTGYRHIRAVPALGESGLDAMEYLVDSWAGDEDPRNPWRYLPEDLWTDQGPLVKYPATADLLRRLGVNIAVGAPYQHNRQKGIESGWRGLWQRFEGQFFLRHRPGAKFTIRLTDYQAELVEYLAQLNAKPSRCDVNLSRRDAWVRLLNQRGGGRPCPADALETLATEVHRTLDACGVFSWDNRQFEVPRYHSRRIIARRALDGSDRCIVEIPETCERLEATPHQIPSYGTFRGQPPMLPAEQARERGAQLTCDSPIYGANYSQIIPSRDGADAKVVHLPPRAQPEAPLADPLEVTTTYRNLADAMLEFTSIYPAPLDATNRALVEQAILNAGLERTAVRDLALQLSTLSAEADAAPTKPTLTVV